MELSDFSGDPVADAADLEGRGAAPAGAFDARALGRTYEAAVFFVDLDFEREHDEHEIYNATNGVNAPVPVGPDLWADEVDDGDVRPAAFDALCEVQVEAGVINENNCVRLVGVDVTEEVVADAEEAGEMDEGLDEADDGKFGDIVDEAEAGSVHIIATDAVEIGVGEPSAQGAHEMGATVIARGLPGDEEDPLHALKRELLFHAHAFEHEFEVFEQVLQIFFVFDFVFDDLEGEVVGNHVLAFGDIHHFFVDGDGTLLALDVLLDDVAYKGIFRCVIAAVGVFVPVLGGEDRRAAELDDPRGEERGVIELIGGVLIELGDDGFFHGAANDFGADPVLVVREPFVRIRFVKHGNEFIDIHADDFASYATHSSLLGWGLQW